MSQKPGSRPYQTKTGMWAVRATVGPQRRVFRMPTVRSEAEAVERAQQLATLAERMIAAGVEPDTACDALEGVASAPAGKKLRDHCTAVDRLVGGWRPQSSGCPTFGEVAEEWLSGGLHKRFPKSVRARKCTKSAAANLRLYVYPVVKDVPVDLISRDHCDAILNSLGHLRDNSTRQVTAPLNTILDYCVHPLKLIERSPIPPKWQPKEGDTRALQWLYPSEDARNMAHVDAPLWLRVYFGYLIREGGREAEPTLMTVDQFDFEDGRNTACLHAWQTKTGERRLWQLEAGTARALRRWFRIRGAKPTDLAFVNGDGERINPDNLDLPVLLRELTRAAGTTRRELFETTPDSRNLVVHDLRRSFVTVKFSLGHSENWIMARTGHETSEELSGYKKAATTFAELKVGDFAPLDEAIPELRGRRQNSGTASAKLAKELGSPYSIVEIPAVLQAPVTTKKPVIARDASPPSPVQSDARAASVPQPGAFDAQLAAAVTAAVAAGVAQLSGSLAVQVAAAVAAEFRRAPAKRKRARR